MATQYDAILLGALIGRAMADDVNKDDLPPEWTGLDPQDGDYLMSNGIDPDSELWAIAEQAAENAYNSVVKPSVYVDMLVAGVPIGHHASDLFVKMTPESTEILKRHPQITASTFVFDGELWYDIPFGFDPYWYGKLRRDPK